MMPVLAGGIVPLEIEYIMSCSVIAPQNVLTEEKPFL
jgi:hypothetical protein